MRDLSFERSGMKPAVGILVGGASRRMRQPKALIQVGGASLLERTVHVARSVVEDVMLIGLPPFELPTAVSSLPILEDHHPGIGPIAGLHSLLTARPKHGVILLACDMPYLHEAVLHKLIAAGGDFDAAVCNSPDAKGNAERWHPCCALYHASAQPAVQSAIESRQYSLIQLLSTLRTMPIELVGEESRWVENWNTPEDRAKSIDSRKPS